MVTATVTRTETVRVQNTPGLLTGGVLLQGSHLGGERFSIGVADSDLAMARAELQSPNAIPDTDPTTLMSFLRAEQSLDEAVATGRLQLAGDRGSVEQLDRLFPVPNEAVTR
jgi:putative sterol carrier protein